MKYDLLKLEGYMHASYLDLHMRYYHIKLSPGSKHIYNTVLLWGKYEYQALPMEVNNIPYIFQEMFESLNMEYVYIYNLMVTTKTT